MSRISETEDDKLYIKAMFDDALGEHYLGNPAVVGKLVADYCQTVRDMLIQRAQGTIDAPEFVARVKELGVTLSAIFSGRDTQYKPIIGWNTISLGARLRVALGQYWSDNREAHHNDPIQVLFAWLCWGIYDAINRANGDDDMENLLLSDRTEAAIRLLLGTDRRA